MDKKAFIASGLIEKYILGLTSEDEDRIVEKFMESDDDVKAKIFDGQDCFRGKSRSKISISRGQLLQYVAIGLLAVSTFYLWNSNQSLNQTKSTLSARLDDCSDSFAAVDTEKATLTSNEFILTHSATERVRLRGTNLSPEASMLAFYNPKAEVLMIKIDQLPPPPEGKYYHMWADVNGEMIHVGSLSNDAVNLTSLSFVSEAASLNVTIEDIPDVDHPDVNQLALRGEIF